MEKEYYTYSIRNANQYCQKIYHKNISLKDYLFILPMRIEGGKNYPTILVYCLVNAFLINIFPAAAVEIFPSSKPEAAWKQYQVPNSYMSLCRMQINRN